VNFHFGLEKSVNKISKELQNIIITPNYMSTLLFKNRRLLIATKHEKEKSNCSFAQTKPWVICFVNENFDTDLLGTLQEN
jgi:hypothetical protein